jgi:hypothetical protein
MPPQQGDRLLDLFDGALNFRPHDKLLLAGAMARSLRNVKGS